MWKSFRKQFFAGLVIVIPLSITIYFIRLLFLLLSQSMVPLLLHEHWVALPRPSVRPISFVLTLLLIWFIGWTASNFIGKHIVGSLEKGIQRIPFFRGVYEAIQKVTEAFFGTRPLYQSVVLVEYPRKGVFTFGFVTSHISGKLFNSQDPYLCVFVPTVPNPTSGLLLYVRQLDTIPLNLSIEDAAKILVSHGFVPIPESAINSAPKSEQFIRHPRESGPSTRPAPATRLARPRLNSGGGPSAGFLEDGNPRS